MLSHQQRVKGLLSNVSLAAKVVAADSYHIDFLLNQLKDPQNYRPLKTLSDSHDRELFYNPKTATWETRNVGKRVHHSLDRGLFSTTDFGYPKKTSYTKKTSVTLLPPHGKMRYYDPKGNPPVVLLFDLNLCHLKDEKYIFSQMANTDQRWWLNRPGKNRQVIRSISLESLRQTLLLASPNKTLDPNELLV